MDENLSRGFVYLPSYVPRSGVRDFKPTSISSPRDRYNLIYFAFLLAGIGFLLPYNSFIMAVDFFQHKYPGTTVIFDMSLTYICVAFLTVLLNNVLVEVLPMKLRISFGYVLSFVTMLFMAMCQIRWDFFDQNVSYGLTLMAVAIVSMGCTMQQSSFYGYTSMLPPRYTQAVMTGESMAGVLISLNRIITKSLPNEERTNTLIFFLLSVFLAGICSILNSITHKTKFVNFYVLRCREQLRSSQSRTITLHPTEEVSLVDILEISGTKGKYGIVNIQSPSKDGSDSAFQSSENINPSANSFDNPLYGEVREENKSSIMDLKLIPASRTTSFFNPNYEEVCCGRRSPRRQYHVGHASYSRRPSLKMLRRRSRIFGGFKEGMQMRMKVSRIIWPYMLSIAIVYFVTLSLFPGIMSEIVSCNLMTWMPVMIMMTFNLFDVIGKILASVPYEWKKSQLLFLSCIRVFLIPLLMMCASSRSSYMMTGEGWAFVFSLMLGLSNGVLGSLPMIIASTKVSEQYKEISGNIMTLSYIIGLTGGSLFAYFLDYLLGPTIRDPCSSNSSFSWTMGQLVSNTSSVSAASQAISSITAVPSVSVNPLSSSLSSAVLLNETISLSPGFNTTLGVNRSMLQL